MNENHSLKSIFKGNRLRASTQNLHPIIVREYAYDQPSRKN